jgi:hypothetical protein
MLPLSAMKLNTESSNIRNRPLRRIVSQYYTGAHESIPVSQEFSFMVAHDSYRHTTDKRSSMRSIPIQVCESTPMDEDLQQEEFNLRRVYESATWRMYNRITASRRVSNNSKNRNSSSRIQDNDQMIKEPRPFITRTRTPELFYAEDDDDCFTLSHHVMDDDMLVDDSHEGVFDLEFDS